MNDTSDPGCEATQERRALWSSSPKLSLLIFHPLDLPSSSSTSPWSGKRLGEMSIPSKSQVNVGVGWPKTCQKKTFSMNLSPSLPNPVIGTTNTKFAKNYIHTQKKSYQKMANTKYASTVIITLQIAIPVPCTSSCLFWWFWPFMWREGLSRSTDDNFVHLDC